MSADKKQKPKPPRPPAPNLGAKKSIQKQAASGFSFSFNDLKLVDSDDEEKSFVQFTKSDTHDGASTATKKPKEIQSLLNTNPKTKEMKPLSLTRDTIKNGDWNSFGSEEDIYNESSQQSSVKSKPIEVEPIKKVREEVQRASSTTSTLKKETGAPNDAGKAKPKLLKAGSGVLKVATEVLEEKENESFKLPSDSQEALADPLSFLDKVMEDQLGSSYEDEEDVGSRRSRRRNDGRNTTFGSKKKTLQQRAKSLDVEIGQAKEKEHQGKNEDSSLDINPYYFNVPTPSELKDEPMRRSDSVSSLKGSHRAQAKIISLSELLASPNVAEDTSERRSVQAGSDGFRTPDMPPNDTDWEKLDLTKPPPHSPPPTSSQAQSPDVEVKPTPGDDDVPLPPLPFYTLHILTFLTFSYFLFPIPTFISGFMTGLFCCFYLVLLLVWINIPPRDRSFQEEDLDGIDAPLVIPGPRMTAAKVRVKEQEKVAIKGWMNELTVPYDPDTYHVNQTHSVYVRLEGHTLRLSRPKQSIARRAMFDEPTPRPEFIHQRIYDIRGSYVYLQPDGLVKKRLWSKKYPLCIELPMKGVSAEKNVPPPDDTAQTLGFDVVKKDECDDKVLQLFARTSREKEEWFWKFEAAAQSHKIGKIRPIQTLHKKVFLVGNDFIGEDGNPIYRVDPEDMSSRKSMVDFYKFLNKIMPKEKESKEVPPVQDVKVKAGGVTYASPGPRLTGPVRSDGSLSGAVVSGDAPVAWVNALIGRFFWDFLREEQWAEIIQAKLQKKLSKIKIPHFMEALTITGTDLGLNAPTIRKASRPTVDARGMWVDLDIHYGGSCWMTLTTKFNLWKLGKDTRMEREMEDMMTGKKEGIEKLERRQMSAALDSDEEDSAESSDDELEETASTTSSEAAATPEEGLKSSSKILRFVNKVTNSSYFQRATQNKYVKRAINEVSNTSVELTVEVKELRGVLALNIPPAPSDRLWYGFRGKPHLWLSAKPKLGTRQVTITHITEYIERKLEKEFQKVFVLPNMDDIPVPIMDFKVEDHRYTR